MADGVGGRRQFDRGQSCRIWGPERGNRIQELEPSTKRKTPLAEMILREVVQDCFVDLAVPEYRLVLCEAKAPQPTPEAAMATPPWCWSPNIKRTRGGTRLCSPAIRPGASRPTSSNCRC
jgi:hypothetical protein